MVRAGIIGLGLMGATHARVYSTHPKAELVGLADADEGRLANCRHMLPEGSSVALHRDPYDLLNDERIELVSICVPTPWHRRFTEEALRRGKSVLCEKPMALCGEDADAMTEAAAESNGKLMIAHCIRFWPAYVQARELVSRGALGRIRAARFVRQAARPAWSSWLADEAQSGGAILDMGIHDIDFVQQTLGLPQRVRVGGPPPSSKLDLYYAILQINEATVVIEGGWFFPGDFPFSMAFDIVGDEAMVSFDSRQADRLTIYRPQGAQEVLAMPAHDGYWGEIDYFLTCIEENRFPDLSPPRESARSVKLALLLRNAREQPRMVLPVVDL